MSDKKSSTPVLEVLPKDPLLFTTPVSAGFPSPADDHVDRRMDLHEYLVKHPAATFFVRVAGDSMHDAGILEGDMLVVDRALEARDGQIIVAIVNREFTVKRLKQQNGIVSLVAENPNYKPIIITDKIEFEPWGVVVGVVRKIG